MTPLFKIQYPVQPKKDIQMPNPNVVESNYEKLKEIITDRNLTHNDLVNLTGYSKQSIEAMTMPKRGSPRARTVSPRFLSLLNYALKEKDQSQAPAA